MVRKARQVKRLNQALERVNVVMVRIKFWRLRPNIIGSKTTFRNRHVPERRQATRWAIIVRALTLVRYPVRRFAALVVS
jgi:hypothetical protein